MHALGLLDCFFVHRLWIPGMWVNKKKGDQDGRTKARDDLLTKDATPHEG
jgi:hypothetical protein